MKNKLKQIQNNKSIRSFLCLILISLVMINLTKVQNILITNIVLLFLVTFTLIVYQKLYCYFQFFILISLCFLICYVVPGLIGVYFLAWFFTFMLFYLYKKTEFYLNFAMLAWLGFVISFFFFELYFLYEVKDILFTAQHIVYFTPNSKTLTLTFKILLTNSYFPYPHNELQFLLTKDSFGDLLFFLSQYKSVNFATNFISIYAYSIYWLASYIPYIKVCIVIC